MLLMCRCWNVDSVIFEEIVKEQKCRGMYGKDLMDGDESSGIRSLNLTEGEVESWPGILIDAI